MKIDVKEQVAAVEAKAKEQGRMQKVWCYQIGISPITWQNWRRGVSRPTEARWLVCRDKLVEIGLMDD